MKYLLSFLFLGISLVSFAQNRDNQQKMSYDFTAEQQAILKTKKMALDLDLSATQQSQILKINKKRVDEHKAKMKTYKAMKEDGTKPTSDERFKMMNDKLDSQLAHQAEIKKILNKDQYDSWKKSQKYNKMKFHRKHNAPKRTMQKNKS